ncbi:MAG: hypothetical protein ACLVL2_11050 [Bacteroides cellulosilyticus]
MLHVQTETTIQYLKALFEEKANCSPVKVETSKVDGKWRLLVDGQELYVKGAACNNFYAEAADFGANVVRTYGVSDKSKAILDAAQENGLYVNFGLYIKRNRRFRLQQRSGGKSSI